MGCIASQTVLHLTFSRTYYQFDTYLVGLVITPLMAIANLSPRKRNMWNLVSSKSVKLCNKNPDISIGAFSEHDKESRIYLQRAKLSLVFYFGFTHNLHISNLFPLQFDKNTGFLKPEHVLQKYIYKWSVLDQIRLVVLLDLDLFSLTLDS